MIERLIAWLVKRPLGYDLVRVPLGLYALREENPAFRIWVSFLLQTHKQAFARTRPVVWCSALLPTEIVYGLGGIPIHPEVLASLMAYFDISNWFLEKANTRISTDLCSFYRIALGMAMADHLPRPDFLLSSSSLCDGSNKFFGYLSQFYGVPHFFVDVPYHNGNQGRRYLTDQLENLIDSIPRLTGLLWRRERMERVAQLSNRARNYLLQIQRTPQGPACPFPRE